MTSLTLAVEIGNDGNQPSIGTGFVISDGYLVTAWHVVKNHKNLYVGSTKSSLTKANIIKYDESKDLVLLSAKIDTPPLAIADWASVPIGVEVYTIGYPQPSFMGLSKKISSGIFNGSRKEDDKSRLFQFSAETSKGSSGGPVFSSDGLVIGVTVKKLDALKVSEKNGDLPGNVNYGIKSYLLVNFLKESGLPITVKPFNEEVYYRPHQLFYNHQNSIYFVLAQDSELFSKID